MKLKGFTLIEIMVALVISSVVIGLAVLFFLNMQKYAVMFNTAGDENSEVIRLNSTLLLDQENCEFITGYNSRLTFVWKEHEVLYQFTDRYVIRESPGVVDTFFVPTYEVVYTWHPVLVKKVTQVSFLLRCREMDYQISLRKEYLPGEVFNEKLKRDVR